MKTLIKKGIVVTMNQKREVFPDGYVLMEGTQILETGPMEQLRRQPEEAMTVVDARRAIVMPGMVNTHCHMGMIPFRGLGDDCRDRLRVFLLPMEAKAVDAELVECSTRYAVCELLLSGVTTVLDMYYFADRVAGVMDRMGIRGIAAETVMEDATCDAASPQEAMEYGSAVMAAYRNHPRVRGCIAAHGTTTCSPETLKRIHERDASAGLPFTLHVAEMDYEMKELRDRYGCTPVEYLKRLGVLDPLTVAAHSIQLTENDIRLLKENGSSVAHCIGSNTKAAKGVAPVSDMLRQQIAVGLGTDGPASGNTLDLFTQMRFCANFHKNHNRDRSAFPAAEITAMATIGGARALGMERQIGSLEPGKQADLVLVETDSPNMFPVYDPYSALVYSARAENVREVYVAGRCLVRNKQLIDQDFREIREKLREKMDRTAFREMKNMVN